MMSMTLQVMMMIIVWFVGLTRKTHFLLLFILQIKSVFGC